MRNSLFLGVAIAAAVALSNPMVASAQVTPSASPSAPAGEQGHHHGGGMQRMLSQLNLSADQKAKIDHIRQDQSLDRQGRMSAVMAVLTAEQQAQLKTLMAQHHHGPPGGGAPGQ